MRLGKNAPKSRSLGALDPVIVRLKQRGQLERVSRGEFCNLCGKDREPIQYPCGLGGGGYPKGFLEQELWAHRHEERSTAVVPHFCIPASAGGRTIGQ